MNPLFAIEPIKWFLNSFPSKSRRRGNHYYRDGAVIKCSCVKQDLQFTATVRGSQIYVVTFDYNPAQQAWSASCTCPIMDKCKHAYAAMLALSANAAALSVALKPPAKREKKKSPATPPPSPETPQPPPSPLSLALAQGLGRRLDPREVDYVQRVQWLFHQAHRGHIINLELLRQLAPTLREYGWEPLSLWPSLPSDDHEFWLYCAYELQRRGLPLPVFMQPVTDFGRVQAALDAWKREKAIAHWRSVLAQSSASTEAPSNPIDLRLMILPEAARLQWKTASDADFKNVKQSHLRRFCDDYENGELALLPEALGLWQSFYKPYDFYTACNLEFGRSETVRGLSKAFRIPELADRTVTADGTPIERFPEPLRYRLTEARDEADDYRLGLTLPDGTEAPRILLTLPGRPALYLSERTLFQGPPPHGFSVSEPLRIPAPALEDRLGVNFLSRLNVDLPPRLAHRTRHVPAVIKIQCALKATYSGSDTQSVFVCVTADAPGEETEHFHPQGWCAQSYSGRKKTKKPDSDGIISLVDRAPQRHFPNLLENVGAKWDEYEMRWRVRLTRNFPEVFVPWLESLPPEIEVELDSELATLRDAPLSGSVRLDIQEAGVDWFDLRVALNVSDLELTPDELKLLLNARGRFVRLGKKGWRRLQFDFSAEDDERLARLGLDAREFSSEPQRLHALQLADDAARKFLPEQQAESIHRRAAELKTRVTPPVPPGIQAQLRPYQLEGFHFLAYLTANHFGGVLADDMGLGKTVQTLTWLAWLRQGAPIQDSPAESTTPAIRRQEGESPALEGARPLPSLVVCPKSVMDNWHTEAARFCPALRVRIWRGEDVPTLETARADFDLVVMNYAQLRSLSPAITQFRWQVIVLDEAQYIKNPESQTAQVARALVAEHRLALTGTPIENRLLDLWSIFAFAMPGVLGNRAQFARRFSQQDDPFARRRLAARVRPFLLRRTKAQVAQDLPDRVEEDIVCELEAEQNTLYRAEFKRAQALLLNIKTSQDLNEQRFNFLSSLLRLRQICCHPALVDISLIQAESAKVNALLDLLEPLMEEGHKVLVFSQFVTMLNILRDAVQKREWPHFYLAGETENRGELVAEFQKKSGAAVFLISLKAGGFGLNLTAASYVVLFDPWWNPAVEMQAIDRTHRIGQTSKVIAYRLLMKDSIEQKIRQLQRGKAALAQDVLGDDTFAQTLTLDDLKFLFAET